jgi:hypothetical protein
MSEVWKLDNQNYVLYTESKDIMRRIKRYYKDFTFMAEYQRNGKIFARQWLVPVKRKRVAFRLEKVA